jgi:6-pyruvoyltetrahydropterin/6-carboxytetrahydropterin synthase
MNTNKEFTFEASHILSRHEGKCSRLHGHSWRVLVELEGPVQSATGFVLDYAMLSGIVDPIIQRFDHRHLNAFIRYPSAENIAAHIADLVRARLNLSWVNDLVVGVSETKDTWAFWKSRNREDISMLNTADPSAEWKSPDVPTPLIATHNRTVIENLEDQIHLAEMRAAVNLADFQKNNEQMEQWLLYRESLVDNPELPFGLTGKESLQ